MGSDESISFLMAQTEEQAALKYDIWKSRDPFSDIPPALLNSADIAKYVAATSVLFPFEIEHLKSAAYEMRLSPEIWWWDKSGALHKRFEKDEAHCIRRNSIAFFTTEENFYLPDYLVARFNLVIKHVHQGMLLGTGPLVNPGYCGKLMIPLHNLTNNDYSLHIGEPIISVEFTKISPNKRWTKDSISNIYTNCDMQYVENKSLFKTGADFSKYLNRAKEEGKLPTISSSIIELDVKVNKFEKIIAKYKNIAIFGAIVAVITILCGLGSIYMDMMHFINNTASEIRGQNERLLQQSNERSREIEELKFELEAMKAQHPERLDDESSPEISNEDTQQTGR